MDIDMDKGYYDKEERIARLEKLWEGKRRYIEGNLYEEVKTACEGYDCPTLLVNVYTRKMKTGDLDKTCEVIAELIKHIARKFGWECIIQKVFKEFDTDENTFWIKCEFTPSSTKEKNKLIKATADTKEILLELWKSTSEEKIELLAEKMTLFNTKKNTEKSVSRTIEELFLINIKFGSPPKR